MDIINETKRKLFKMSNKTDNSPARQMKGDGGRHKLTTSGV